MVEDNRQDPSIETFSTEEWLSRAQNLVPRALDNSRAVKVFTGKWKMIISRLEQIPSKLSNLSSHPCFSMNPLCKEQLQAICITLNEVTELSEICSKEKYEGKLQMQSDLDAISGKLDLNLRDCGLLIKTGVLGEVSFGKSDDEIHGNVKELLARLQIGNLEAKCIALDRVLEAMREDEKTVMPFIGRSNVAALVQLLTATSPGIREKTVTIICSLVESENFENWLVNEGVLPPLIRIVESGSLMSKEKCTISLQRLSLLPETARLMVGFNGIRPLIEICKNVDSITQASAACTLKNISMVPELRQALFEEGIVKVMIDLLDNGILLGTKEYAAECLQNLTLGNEKIKNIIISDGGIRSLLCYLDGPLPQECAIVALKNLANSVPVEFLVSLGIVPRLVHVLQSSSILAQQASASTICRICDSIEMKRLVGESGCIPLLVKMLEGKSHSLKQIAAQALSMLMSVADNFKEVKRDDKSVPNLVALLDQSPHNTAKKYAVLCLLMLSSSKKCRKLMISYGAIGYLKKLTEMEVLGAEKLLESLARGKLKSFFSRK